MGEFCVYLTIYSGNRLPPFYIGSTSLCRLAKGYVGSVVSKRYGAIWKAERTRRPHLFRTIVLATFASREQAFEREKDLQRKLKVISNPLYANRSYGHKHTAGGWNVGVPAWNKGRKWSIETIERIRVAKSNPSAATRAKISAANKGRSAGDNNPSRMPGVGAKISAAKKGVPLGRPSWHSGKTGVYSEEVIAGMRARMLGVKNAAVSAANKRRTGMKYNKALKPTN
jgi:hypothetical protein